MLYLQVVIQQGTSFIDTFRHSTDPVYKKIWKERIEPYVDGYPSVNIDHYPIINTLTYLLEYFFIDIHIYIYIYIYIYIICFSG